MQRSKRRNSRISSRNSKSSSNSHKKHQQYRALSSYTLVNNASRETGSSHGRDTGSFSRRRVVVTGTGIVSSLGTNSRQVFSRVLQGESAIREIDTPELLTLNLQTKSYAPVGVIAGTEEEIPRHLKQIASRHQTYALIAAYEAMRQAELIPDDFQKIVQERDLTKIPNPHALFVHDRKLNPKAMVPPLQNDPCFDGFPDMCGLCEGDQSCAYTRDTTDRLGVCIGSSIGCVEEIGASHVKIAARGGKGAGAYSLPKLLVNIAAGHISQLYQGRALNHAVSTACATGAHAIGDALSFIRNNKADVVICGGTETGVSPLSLALFNRIHALSRQPPESSGGPFTKTRDGFVMGEGAGMLVLESLDHALARGANILCEVVGYGISSDAYHVTQPHRLGRGAFMAMSNALDDANLTMNDVDYINAHATSTPSGDDAETIAIRALTQIHYHRQQQQQHEHSDGQHHQQPTPSSISSTDYASVSTEDQPQPETSQPKTSGTLYRKPYVSSTKGSVGHLLGAAGAFEAIMSIYAIKDNAVPPTNLRGGQIADDIPVNVVYIDQNTKTTRNWYDDLSNKSSPLDEHDSNGAGATNGDKHHQINAVLSNSFGFGGANASLLFKRYEDSDHQPLATSIQH